VATEIEGVTKFTEPSQTVTYLLQQHHVKWGHVIADQLVGGFIVDEIWHLLQNI
jgi:hypothetical protein